MPDTHDAPADPFEVSLARVLQHIHTYSFTTKSDLAREYADEIAAGASRGYLNTRVVPGRDLCGRRWKITADGIYFLTRMSGTIADEEIEAYEAKLQAAPAGEPE